MTIANQLLKETLTQIKLNEYQVPEGTDSFELAKQMMQDIGSPDPVLRDELIYSIMANWISSDRFTFDELRELLSISIDDQHLYYRLGEIDTNSVFTRAFSVLMIPLIIGVHLRSPFLQDKEIKHVNRLTIQYLIDERDHRGYVDELGWAHAIAHAADALDELAQCKEIDRDDLLSILEVLQTKICYSRAVYRDNEDERIVTAVVNILNRNLLEDVVIQDWLEELLEHLRNCTEYLDRYTLKNNIKNFLRSLYFRIRNDDQYKHVLHKAENVLNEIGT